MTTNEALQFLNLKKTYTIEDLNKSFKIYVKKFHPDKNMDHQEWSHKMMIELNESYQLLLSNLDKMGNIIEGPIHCTVMNTESTRTKENVELINPVLIKNAFTQFMQGLSIYYEYGLDNSFIRKEGSRRFRYKEAIRHIQKSIEIFMNYSNQTLGEHIHLRKFVILFFSEMKRENIHFITTKVQRMFQSSSLLLFNIITGYLIPTTKNSKWANRNSVIICYTSFLEILKERNNEETKELIQFKLSLLDALLNLVDFLSIYK